MSSKRNVISMLNMKGGVGKTTLCKEIAYYMSKNGKKVLVVDVDPQSNLTQSMFEKFNFKHYYESDTEDNKNYKVCKATISNLFEYNSIVEDVKQHDFILELTEDLSLIPGDLNALFFERSSGSSESEHAIKNFFEDFKIKEEYDYIFLDCPPTFSFYTTAALLASDFFVSPIHPDSYSILGINLLYKVVQRIESVYRDRFKHIPLKHLGIVFSNIPRQGSITKGMKNLIFDIQNSQTLKDLGVYFFSEYFEVNSYISKRIDYFITDSNSDISYQNLRNLVRELESRIEFFTNTD